jgi:ubiquinone/menaquinone biosynthesis C-methylase UbiE
MSSSEQIKELVKEKYSAIAQQTKAQNETSCCGVEGCGTVDYTVFSENYEALQGYTPSADLGLGCGLPTEFAQIKPGDTVVDLGSGAGNDCFVARAIVGPTGKVIGIDMTERMIEKARDNAEALGFQNVEFRLGDIEKLPVAANKADVVVSNCVLNLVPDKVKALRETFRILKPGGHFSISDVVVKGHMPEAMRQDAELYAGCVAGALTMEEYLQIIREAGFVEVSIQKEKRIQLPEDSIRHIQTAKEVIEQEEFGIYSITVYGLKPAAMACAPGEGCC